MYMTKYIVCPICSKTMAARGLHFHVQNKHPDEYKDTGWVQIRNRAKFVGGIDMKPQKGEGEKIVRLKVSGVLVEGRISDLRLIFGLTKSERFQIMRELSP